MPVYNILTYDCLQRRRYGPDETNQIVGCEAKLISFLVDLE